MDLIKQKKVYTLQGIELLHIRDFCELTGRTPQATRRLIEQGNVVRKMKFYRDRSRLMIPVTEIFGYPFVQAGHSKNERQIFHYQQIEGHDTLQKVLCTKCTFEMGCELRHIADSLEVPEGDK